MPISRSENNGHSLFNEKARWNAQLAQFTEGHPFDHRMKPIPQNCPWFITHAIKWPLSRARILGPTPPPSPL